MEGPAHLILRRGYASPFFHFIGLVGNGLFQSRHLKALDHGEDVLGQGRGGAGGAELGVPPAPQTPARTLGTLSKQSSVLGGKEAPSPGVTCLKQEKPKQMTHFGGFLNPVSFSCSFHLSDGNRAVFHKVSPTHCPPDTRLPWGSQQSD